jgi:histidyl-tRNA synthetase
MPFKRYHIAKVWRGENTQRGRYREFIQCDFDCIGSDSAAADFEILMIIKEALAVAGAPAITIRLNHRGLFNRFLRRIGATERTADILRIVDKLAKTSMDEVLKLLSAALDNNRARQICGYIESKDSWDGTLAAMTEAAGGENPDSERLETLRSFMADTGSEDVFVLDPSITRGLDYYTGVVFETFLNDMPSIGSVCSGGRYDNLATLYSTEKLSGAGSSIGLDRLLSALEALEKTESRETYAEVAVICADETLGGAYQRIAQRFRAAGIPCYVFFETKKQTAQFALAEKIGIRWALIPSTNTADSPVTLRNLAERRNTDALSIDEAIAFLKSQRKPMNE